MAQSLRILCVSLTDDVGTDRLVSDLAQNGAVCAVLAPPGAIAAQNLGIDRHFTMPRRGGALVAPFLLPKRLSAAVACWRPDRVVPLDDLAATLLRNMALKPTSRAVGDLLRRSFGDPAGYEAACGRVALMRVAQDCGVRLPTFWDDRNAGAAVLPVMVKRDQSSGSGGVIRADTRGQLASAIRTAQLKGMAKRMVARLAGLARPRTPMLLQSMVEGRLAMYTAVTRDGAVIDGVGFEAVRHHPTKGSSTILRHQPSAEMAEAAQRLVAALKCSGFVSFDFILDRQGRAFLIEMNPRPIGSAHLGRRFGHDLTHAYLTGTRLSEAAATSDDAIALFPKELERDPTGVGLEDPGVFHDLPRHEPAVLAAYLAWLQAEHPQQAGALARCCGVAAAEQPTATPILVAEPC
ncbi:ATP-grasp domain-containing protein [Lichenihabitans sp. Uapishka_5]|uniref:ATP-grasp domain-containing protein n=1 Tax=Lichenihabitans sp. Uapishka_5 TaxID=3037302 RepID=UPI0029E7D7BE|nr:ATP-grasp domain-containing protein [Lichenihabitans sp. Uapishka_5]MDX7949976.1 ATP-grasp domain-containing protein [Lichenihabitans sp. Uapishka_5]